MRRLNSSCSRSMALVVADAARLARRQPRGGVLAGFLQAVGHRETANRRRIVCDRVGDMALWPFRERLAVAVVPHAINARPTSFNSCHCSVVLKYRRSGGACPFLTGMR
jgi:hypothetical protein